MSLTILSLLHTHFRFNTTLIRTSGRSLGTFKATFFRISGSTGQKYTFTLFCSFTIRLRLWTMSTIRNCNVFGLCPPSGTATFLAYVHHLELLLFWTMSTIWNCYIFGLCPSSGTTTFLHFVQNIVSNMKAAFRKLCFRSEVKKL